MSFQGIDIYEDFGHHPTAIRKVIESFRRDGAHQNKRIIAAFEPRSATARRSILAGDYLKSLALADVALIAPPNKIADLHRLRGLIITTWLLSFPYPLGLLAIIRT